MNVTRRATLAAGLAAVAGRAASAQTAGQPIRFVVPYAPGGNLDITARLFSGAMGSVLGGPIVVENRSGANGTLAGSLVSRAAPDGTTLLVGSNGPVLFAPMVMPNPPYHWRRDLAPVSLLTISTNVLLVRPSLPVHSMQDLVDYGRRNAGRLNLAVSSGASINHFLAALFKQASGLEWTTITYRGNAPALNDMVGGQVDFGFQQLTDAAQHIRNGTLRAIAVLGPTRSAALPDVPTCVEAGFPTVQGVTFAGLLAPAGTPQAVLERVSAAIRSAAAQADVRERLAAVGAEARGSTPAEFAELLATETEKWERVMRETGLDMTG